MNGDVPKQSTRTAVSSGTVWERLAGYSRAVRYGNHIYVSGTTATAPDGEVVGRGDPAAQTHFVIDKIEQALQQLGGCLEDTVRTRLYIRHITDWEPVARIHGERFGPIRPANTLVQAQLVGDDYLVEMEAEAVIGAGAALTETAHEI
ncbi:MAG: RidA family protein [Caldilineaceae bacterium]